MTQTKLVPVEPTQEMLDAAWQATVRVSAEERMANDLGNTRKAHDVKMRQRYKAMLAAVAQGNCGGGER